MRHNIGHSNLCAPCKVSSLVGIFFSIYHNEALAQVCTLYKMHFNFLFISPSPKLELKSNIDGPKVKELKTDVVQKDLIISDLKAENSELTKSLNEAVSQLSKMNEQSKNQENELKQLKRGNLIFSLNSQALLLRQIT